MTGVEHWQVWRGSGPAMSYVKVSYMGVNERGEARTREPLT